MKLSDVTADLKRQALDYERTAKGTSVTSMAEEQCAGTIAEVIRGIIKLLEQVSSV